MAARITDTRAVPTRALGKAMRALAIDRVSAEVVTSFDAAEIPSILLKGPSIAAWLYPSGGRTYGDTDLLVAGRQFRSATEVLTALDFRSDSERFSAFERENATELSFVRRSGGWGEGKVVVDLHRNMHGLASSDEFVWAMLQDQLAVLVVGGIEMRVLNRPALALHIVVHAVHHRFGFHTGEDLRRVVAACSLDDWTGAANLAQTLGIEDVLSFGLRHESAGATIADQLRLPVMAIADSPDGWDVTRGLSTFSRLSSAGSLAERARCIRWTLLPSRARIMSGSDLTNRRRRALARAYLARWRHVAAMVLPAARRARAHRRSTRASVVTAMAEEGLMHVVDR